jgi:hypothetical protein
MTSTPLRSITPTIDVYVKLAQYPILADTIRTRMREELFRRGVVSQADFEREIEDLAVESQRQTNGSCVKIEYARFIQTLILPTAWASPCWNRSWTIFCASGPSIRAARS